MKYQRKNKGYQLTTYCITAIFLLLITGCSSGFFRGSGDNLETYNFRTGTKGVSIDFVEGMPPDTVYVGTDFAIGVKIKNEGAYDITGDSSIRLVPTDPTAFIFEEGSNTYFELNGKSLYIQEGGEDVISFPTIAACFRGYDGTTNSAIKTIKTKIKAEACYEYATEGNFDICIDTQSHQRKPGEKTACEMQDVTSSGQGGPVGVTKIKVDPPITNGEIMTLQIPITIKKLTGTDTTIFSMSVQNCDDYDEKDKVDVDVEIGGIRMDCEPNTIELKASQNEPNILCRTEIDPSLGAYKTPLSIRMTYRVLDSKLKDIEINAPPGNVQTDCSAITHQQTGQTTSQTQ